MQNFFLRPGSNVPNEIFDLLKNGIESSEICKIAMAFLTHQKIPELLQRRSELGLRTQILLNSHDLIRPSETDTNATDLFFPKTIKDIFKIIERLRDENIKIKILGSRNPAWAVMHHKFVIFDNLVGFGSLNFTKLGFTQNYENFSFSDETTVIANFRDEFDALWTMGSDLLIDGGHLRNLVCPKCNHEEGIDFESYGLLCTLCNTKFRFA